MRLTSAQVEAIKQETEHFFGARAEVWLFGSRVDDAAKGGDVLPTAPFGKIEQEKGYVQ